MLRVALFTALLLAGVLFVESLGWRIRDEAWLLAALIAAIVLFFIPRSGNTRDTKDLIFNLVSALGIYGIVLKFRPWLADTVGQAPATVVSGLLVLVLAGIVLLLPAMIGRSNAPTDNVR